MNNQQHISKFATAFFSLGILSLFLAVGCSESSNAGTSQAKALPKLSFHKPRNFGLAVERIRTIHDELTTSDELPLPISYTVAEVSDGNSEVRYELVSASVAGGSLKECECGHDHGDTDHDHEEEQPEKDALADSESKNTKDDCEVCDVHATTFTAGPATHTVYIDVFTELDDVVKWLPSIVDDSDFDSSEQEKIVAASQQLATQLKSFGAESEAEKKKQYLAEVDSINKLIEELETNVKPNAAAILN